jgi:citrate synthase
MSGSAKLDIDGQSLLLPIIEGTEGEKAFDITKLRSETGHITLDQGYMNTGSCQSAITFLDGEKGILRYRGYDIEELAEKSCFAEVSYLLLYGHLPTSSQLLSFSKECLMVERLPAGLEKMIKETPSQTHPMAILSAAMVILSGYHPEFSKEDLNSEERDRLYRLLMNYNLLLTAAIYHRSLPDPIPAIRQDFSYSQNFIHLMFSKSATEIPDTIMVKALEILLILHADHEQNCSASTVRLVGSSKANLFASLSAGVNALWGSSHGGANQAVIEMLHMIYDDGGDYKTFLEKTKSKDGHFRLMGFGHRVYKNFDPRAKIIKKTCDEILGRLGIHDPILELAKGLEEEALRDSYFVDRKLYPNVDFYSGIIYKALGIPTEMFTVMFALGRTPGWMAQWKEMIESSYKIGRPRQIYTGPQKRPYHSQSV